MAAAFQIQQQDVQGGGRWGLVQLPLEARPHCFYDFAAGLEAHKESNYCSKGFYFIGSLMLELQTEVTMKILYHLEMPLSNCCLRENLSKPALT